MARAQGETRRARAARARARGGMIMSSDLDAVSMQSVF
jgi:hypothetical protein